MNYLEIVNLVFTIIFGIYALFMLHFILIGFIGIIKKKKYPKTDIKYRYGVIIPARNEEKVVGGLIDSILSSDYPLELLDIFVIAHNCTDRTAEVARSKGVHVYEYSNPDERTMGFAFKHLFEQIEKDYGTSSYDGFFLFNSDNIVAKDYFSKMNDAFHYFDKKHVVTSYRNSKNFGTNVISGLYGIYFSMGCIFESRGRTVIGCSTRVQGTGYVIPSSIVKNGWKYTSLTEDWEFSVDQIIDGQIIKYCDEATFYDEQPTSFKIMWRQRVRWSRGHLLVCYDRLKDLFTNLFTRKGKNKFSTYDMISNILPFCLLLTLLGVIQFILVSLAPLFTDLSFYDVFISSNHNIFTSSGYLFSMLRNAAISYATTVISAIGVFILERKRIQGVNIFKRILLCLIWPLFLALQFPMDVQAFFSKNLDWKPIPHEDHKTLTNV